ncbi:MAG: BatD family protein [Planctomycetes bacterium]|nr:BatD family protein [Planctomycetota bacterium]
MNRWILIILLVAATAAPLRASQATPEGLQVALSSALVKLGEPVGIIVRVEGDRRVRFGPLPKVSGLSFSKVTQTGRQSSVSYDARGRPVVEQRTTFEVRVQPGEVGKYSIPPLSIELDGQPVQAPAEAMTLEVVQDIAASQLLLFEREDLPATVYEGQPYTLELRFGWDVTRKLADAELQLPWWERQEGVIEVTSPVSQTGTYEIPIRPGRRAAAIEKLPSLERGGRRFDVYRLRRRFVATRPGTVEFGRSLFKFSELVGRGGVFSRGASRDFYAPIDPFEIEVLPVPEEGRPVEWSGAVGEIEATRSVPRRDIDLGDAIELEVRWFGEGNLEFFDPPDLSRLPAFDQFRVLGVEDRKSPDDRVVTYDLVPLDPAVKEVPGVPLSVFDTGSGRFITTSTEPIEIRVTATAGADGDPFGPTEEAEPPLVMRDIQPRQGSAGEGPGPGPGPLLGGLMLAAAIAGWATLRGAVRRRGDPAGVRARQRRAALSSLRRELRTARGPEDSAAALERFLARRSGSSPEFWIGRSSLSAAGATDVSPELEQRFAALRGELDRALFGGEGSGGSGSDGVLVFAQEAVKEGL